MDGQYASVTQEGFTVESNTADEASIRASFDVDTPEVEAPAAEPAAAEVVTEQKAEPEDPILARNEDGTFKQKAKKGSVHELRQNIAKATWEREEEKRRADRLEAQIAELKAERAKPAEAPKPQPVAQTTDDSEPDPKKYAAEEYDPKYLKDYAKWEARHAVREAEQARAQRDTATSMQSAMDRVHAEGTKKYKEFDAELNAVVAAKLQFPPVLTDIILSDPLGHDLAHEYATHLDDLRRLSSLSPVAAATAIGKVLARLETPHSGSVSSSASVSAAKPPIQPVGSSPNADADDPDDSEPLEKHILRYNAADRKLGRR